MNAENTNLCANIFKEIRCSEWNGLQNHLIFQCTNPNKCNDGCSSSWPNSRKFEGGNYQLIHISNKLSIEISAVSKMETIENYIESDIFNFGIDLFFGSVQQNLNVLLLLKKMALKRSTTLGFLIPLSIYLKLTPRQHCIGGLKNNKNNIYLKMNHRIILTTNRGHASSGCHKQIYVNAKSIINELQICDVICLGKDIELKVVGRGDEYVDCEIMVPGSVTPRMNVMFPTKFDWAKSRVSIEELEDLAFAMGTNINVVISNSHLLLDDYQQIRNVLKEFNCDNFYLFTRLTSSSVFTDEDTKWIAGSYDGFLIECFEDSSINTISKLSINMKILMEKCFRKRKPIFLSGNSSKYVHPSDYQCIFYYPDKFILPCSSNFLHIFEAIFEKLAPTMCTVNDFQDNSLTGSTTLARSIAAASFDFKADALVISTVAGQMALKIAHFRPKTPIIAVTTLKNVLNYTSMHHNIWTLLFDSKSGNKASHNNETHQKLVYGIQYALLHKIVENNSCILLVYRTLLGNGYTDKFVVIKFDENYVETIRGPVTK